MNRLLNILVLVDQTHHLDCEVEKAFRLLGRVITLGKGGRGYGVDFNVPDTSVSVSHCVKQLPPSLKPDIVIVSENVYHSFNEWPDEMVKIYIGESVSSREALTHFKLVVVVSEEFTDGSDPARVNIPYCEKKLSAKVMSDVIKCAFGQGNAKNFSEYELLAREQKKIVPEGSAFVIAVLDESPSSDYGIETLLKDLESLEGEVICVFNNKSMGEKYASHPRITKSATLSENVGVGRAWNMGMMMTTQPTVFILNSDLHLEQKGVDSLRKALYTKENVALVGPCGGFNDFQNLKDLHYIEKKNHAGPTLVDQISGFYFAIKRELFSKYSLQFYPEYIPCYMEEWDLAMQMKKYDLLALRVPIYDYDHTWGGTVEGLDQIECLGISYDKTKILSENQNKFILRWQQDFDKLKNNVYLPN